MVVGSCCTLPCLYGVTDVKRNVWVVKSLLWVPVELHQWTYPTTPPMTGLEAKWCEAGSSPTSSITPPQPIPLVCLSVKRWWGGCWGVVGRSKEVEWSGVLFIYQLPHQLCVLFSNFQMKPLKVVNSALLGGLFSMHREIVSLLLRASETEKWREEGRNKQRWRTVSQLTWTSLVSILSDRAPFHL